jgi:hypothetical protein
MRWVASLLALGFLGVALFYFLAVRDRSFSSYAGVEVGMQLRTAITRLQRDGYMIIRGPSEVRDRDCSGEDRYTLVYGPDPTYALTISPDGRCKVSEIARSLRGSDL